MQETPIAIYIVTNQYGNGLNVRSKPDTRTGSIMRFMTNGEGFQAYDIFTIGNQTWSRVSRGNQVIQEYACIAIGNKIYAREQQTPPTDDTLAFISHLKQYILKLDKWARANGFDGDRL